MSFPDSKKLRLIASVKVLGRIPTANEYIEACRINRFKAAKLKKDAEECIMWQAAGMPKITGSVFVSLTWFEETAKRDPDNVAFGKKFILDALQKCGKLPNDNAKYISGFTDDFRYGEEQGVLIEIFEEDHNEH